MGAFEPYLQIGSALIEQDLRPAYIGDRVSEQLEYKLDRHVFDVIDGH